MRKQVFIITCDFCKKITEVDDSKTLPKGWTHVEVGTENGDPKGAFDLCSLGCTQDWAHARRRAIGEGDMVQCDLCPEWFDLKAIPGHMKKHKRETEPEAVAT